MRDIVQIVILSRDRPEYLKETINSVLNQKLLGIEVEVVISDNSERSEVEEMIGQNYPDENLKYIRRVPSVSSLEHFQLVISECKKKYVVLFHDDDIMHPDYIETMFPFIQKEGVAAVGCSTFVFKDDFKKSLRAKSHDFKQPKTFISEKSFLEQYIPGSSGVAVFPGYMYNTACLKKIKLNNVRRKEGVSDVLMLNSLLTYGPIVWIPDFLMYYRLHDSNDGNNLYTVDHISLLNCMSHNGLDKNTIAASMRFNYLFQWLLAQDIKNIFLWRNRIVFKYLFFKSFYLMSKPDLWKSLLNNRFIKNIILKRF